MAKSIFDCLAARILATLFAVPLLTACPPPLTGGNTGRSGSIEAPARIPLTQTPVSVKIASQEGHFQDITIVMKGIDSSVIARGTISSLCPLNNPADPFSDLKCSGSAAIANILFTYNGFKNGLHRMGAGTERGNGFVTFKMDFADYAQLTSVTGQKLGKIEFISRLCGGLGCDSHKSEISGFGDGFLGLSKAYYYAFSARTPGAESIAIDYVADVLRLPNFTKSWSIGRNGSTLISFTESCSAYGDFLNKPSTCAIEYANQASYAVTTNRDLEPGIYDVLVSVFDNVEKRNVGQFGSKLTVAPHPVASLVLGNAASTLGVGTRLLFDATASVAGVGSTTAYTVSKPAASRSSLLDENTQNPSLLADVPGVYVLTLTISFNGEASTSSVTRTVVQITGAAGS